MSTDSAVVSCPANQLSFGSLLSVEFFQINSRNVDKIFWILCHSCI